VNVQSANQYTGRSEVSTIELPFDNAWVSEVRLVEAQQECLLPDLFGISLTVNGGLYDAAAMVAIGTRIDEVGTLIRDGAAFYLRRDVGGRYHLELHRTPVDLVEKRVRLVGTLVGPNLVNADGVAPA
jgi:hypothetical protein